MKIPLLSVMLPLISTCTEPPKRAHQECEWKQGGGCHLFTNAILENLDKVGLLMEARA